MEKPYRQLASEERVRQFHGGYRHPDIVAGQNRQASEIRFIVLHFPHGVGNAT